MNKKFLGILAVLAGFFSMLRTAEAHHGWAEFDENSEVSMQGTVIEFHFTNPHCVVEYRVMDAKGSARKWQGEFASPPELARKGWTAASLQPGEKFTITGHPAKDHGPELHVTGIRMADGRQLRIAYGN
jgi:hypothetical protein